ncbi:unnamed protein product, partial [Didymodactylos carnosus]
PWAASIRAEGIVRSAYPDVPVVSIHEEDIADVAVSVLLEDGHSGATYTLTGPESISERDMVGAIEASIGRSIRIEKLTQLQHQTVG